MEHKRNHQWICDNQVSENVSTKKQVYDNSSGRTLYGTIDSSLWHETASLQQVAGSFRGRLFDSEEINNMLVIDGNLTSLSSRNTPIERLHFTNQYGLNPSLRLPERESRNSHIEDSSYLDQPYIRNTMTTSFSPISSDISRIHSYPDSANLLSSSNFIKREDNVMLPISLSLNGGEANFSSMVSSCGNRGNPSASLATSFEKENDTLISICQKANNIFTQGGSSYGKDNENSASMRSAYDKEDSSITSVISVQDNGNLNFYQNDINNISFSNYADGSVGSSSGSVLVDYTSLPVNESLNKIHTDFDQSKSAPSSNYVPKPCAKIDAASKGSDSKGTKKASANNFPSNVKSLLSTGMLDGVPVKYVSWSREKNLKGTIQGTRYLCGCKDCNFSKALNAYEFEGHASCKTKHPNNHIYFNNGKTIYAVVQELKNTAQEMLFDAIQTVTGSPINEKNFRIWKASYQAATRELQRIYGKDDASLLS